MKHWFFLILISFLSLFLSSTSAASDTESGEGKAAEGSSQTNSGRIREPDDANYNFFVKAQFAEVNEPEHEMAVPILERPTSQEVDVKDPGQIPDSE